MAVTAAGLIRLKEKIEAKEKSFIQAEAKRDTLMERLKEEWECSSVKKAEKLIETMEAKIKAKSTKYDALVAKIKATVADMV